MLERQAPVAFLLLWSAGFAFVALGLPDSEPFTFLALRYVIVVALLLVALAILRPPLPDSRRDWVDLVVVGVLLQAGYFSLLRRVGGAGRVAAWGRLDRDGPRRGRRRDRHPRRLNYFCVTGRGWS